MAKDLIDRPVVARENWGKPQRTRETAPITYSVTTEPKKKKKNIVQNLQPGRERGAKSSHYRRHALCQHDRRGRKGESPLISSPGGERKGRQYKS